MTVPPVRRIVVGVDGSPASQRALEWAADEAARRGSALEVVHAEFARREFLSVYQRLQESEESVLERAVRLAREMRPEVEVTGTMFEPPAAAALVRASEGAEMLVVGSRGRGALRNVSAGSVAMECAHLARCPVVIVRPDRVAASGGRLSAQAAAGG